MIDLWCTHDHYAAHLAPIWAELDRIGVAGTAWAPPGTIGGARDCHTVAGPENGTNLTGAVLVAGVHDMGAVRHRPIVYVEHGVGQTYRDVGSIPGEPGGPGMDRVVLFVCPSERVARLWRARYPDTAAVAVGCPKLDRWHATGERAPTVRPTVALTWHWPCSMVPETRSAFGHYRHHLAELADWARHAGVHLIGHAHPRWGTRLDGIYHRAEIMPTPNLVDVFDLADVLVADNTSAMYEFASLGRPVVVLNAPWYRRDVHHGLRFWDAVPGRAIDQPDELQPAIARALAGDTGADRLRSSAVASAYAHTDGHATRRAVDAIVELVMS